jgi:hypothetical protein
VKLFPFHPSPDALKVLAFAPKQIHDAEADRLTFNPAVTLTSRLRPLLPRTKLRLSPTASSSQFQGLFKVILRDQSTIVSVRIWRLTSLVHPSSYSFPITNQRLPTFQQRQRQKCRPRINKLPAPLQLRRLRQTPLDSNMLLMTILFVSGKNALSAATRPRLYM